MKHTQGKWEVKVFFEDKITFVVVNRDKICKVITNKEANAKLIAAAPELLEACKEALTELERQLYKTNISEEKDILSIKIGSLKQAIAKAEENSNGI